MSFVKLDSRLLRSTLWIDQDATRLFITSLLLAVPKTMPETPVICPSSNEPAGWSIPAGDYGFVDAGGTGLVMAAGLDAPRGLAALERLQSPDSMSSNPDFDGRRMVRVRGGYVVLNFSFYREKDHNHAARQARYRERQKLANDDAGPLRNAVTPSRVTVVTPSRDGSDASHHRHVTEAEAEEEAKATTTPLPSTVRSSVLRTSSLPVEGAPPLQGGPPPKRELGRRLPEGWQPSPATVAWAREHVPDLDLVAVLGAFRDHWAAAAGANARKRDWDAALRNWLRKEAASGGRRGVGSGWSRPSPIQRAIIKAEMDVSGCTYEQAAAHVERLLCKG